MNSKDSYIYIHIFDNINIYVLVIWKSLGLFESPNLKGNVHRAVEQYDQ